MIITTDTLTMSLTLDIIQPTLAIILITVTFLAITALRMFILLYLNFGSESILVPIN
jgi:hypothetical protein